MYRITENKTPVETTTYHLCELHVQRGFLRLLSNHSVLVEYVTSRSVASPKCKECLR